MKPIQKLSAIVILLCLGALTSVASAQDWTRFRGPNGEGKSDLQGLPTQWSQDQYEWVIELPGKGHSSPTVVDNFLFLASGEANGNRTLHCFNATTGEPIWKDSIKLEANQLHRKNSYASGTPAAENGFVYVAFADEQHYVLLAYNFKGERQWSQDLGTFTSSHGQGVSPIVYDGKVIVPSDQAGPSKVVALDAKTGEHVWTSERNFRKASYATPIIINVNGEDQLVCLCGALGLTGLDPQTGKSLWQSGELPKRTVASPVYGNGLLFATCGSGGRGSNLVGVDPAEQGAVKSERKQNLPYVPTPIVHEGHIYLWNDDGIVCCVDLSGDFSKNVWRERVGGTYSGSPVMIDGKIYCIAEDGEIAVIDAKPEYKFYGKSPLGDESYATPTVANGRAYFRGFHTLACLKAQND